MHDSYKQIATNWIQKQLFQHQMKWYSNNNKNETRIHSKELYNSQHKIVNWMALIRSFRWTISSFFLYNIKSVMFLFCHEPNRFLFISHFIVFDWIIFRLAIAMFAQFKCIFAPFFSFASFTMDLTKYCYFNYNIESKNESENQFNFN